LVREAERAMPRYFFHVRDGGNLIKDEEGVELRSLDEVHREAWEGVRASGRRSGFKGSDDRAYEVTDRTGGVILIYPFERAFLEERPTSRGQ
jgi:hypothetical protein